MSSLYNMSSIAAAAAAVAAAAARMPGRRKGSNEDSGRGSTRAFLPLLLLMVPLLLLLRPTLAAAGRGEMKTHAAASLAMERKRIGGGGGWRLAFFSKSSSITTTAAKTRRAPRRSFTIDMATNAPSVLTLTLSGTGDKIPVLGLGTWKAPQGEVKKAVLLALKQGYRHLDCACDYGNEEEVGEAIKEAIETGVVTRKDLFITSKLWNTFHAEEHVELALRKSLKDLGLDYVDLYLIHFPISLKYVRVEEVYPPEWINPTTQKIEFASVPVRETWAGMEGVCEKGLARNIGISNFNAQNIMDLLTYCKIKPVVNQIELHPYLSQESLVAFCQQEGIALTGFSPLGASSYIQLGMDKGEGVGVLNHPTITALAEKHSRSSAQICLRWAVQRGYAVIPKSTHETRLRDNLNVFDFALSDDDMESIAALDRKLRYNDPGEFCKGMGLPNGYPIYA